MANQTSMNISDVKELSKDFEKKSNTICVDLQKAGKLLKELVDAGFITGKATQSLNNCCNELEQTGINLWSSSVQIGNQVTTVQDEIVDVDTDFAKVFEGLSNTDPTKFFGGNDSSK